MKEVGNRSTTIIFLINLCKNIKLYRKSYHEHKGSSYEQTNKAATPPGCNSTIATRTYVERVVLHRNSIGYGGLIYYRAGGDVSQRKWGHCDVGYR
jgi:hypothetical protein